ncbi:uncharacterized protein K441DRAFT_693225 [Cenococcum geophilum 1.58]|uniref:uncharacterized protein n=1 Tax=Cenococcum geophilum 1.58 TaxID=794803 RepID=UPI00358EBE7B|nr:hypothetical protein K441DRAFT_693225 [Cenococcum geophilum 1.58]
MGLPILPSELWICILSGNIDLTHLWMTLCRETIRKAHIDLHNLGSVRLEGVRYELNVRTGFNRFSGNKKLAYFKYDGTNEDYNRISGRLSYIVAVWRRQMDFYTVGKARTPGQTEGVAELKGRLRKVRDIFRLAKNVFGILPRGRAYEMVMGASCENVKLFAGKYVVFGSRNDTRVTSVGITPMICLSVNLDNEVTDEDNDEDFYRPKSDDTPLDLLMALLDGSSSCDVPVDYSTGGSEEELDEDEDMGAWMSENVVEDGKDSEAERVEGVASAVF